MRKYMYCEHKIYQINRKNYKGDKQVIKSKEIGLYTL